MLLIEKECCFCLRNAAPFEWKCLLKKNIVSSRWSDVLLQDKDAFSSKWTCCLKDMIFPLKDAAPVWRMLCMVQIFFSNIIWIICFFLSRYVALSLREKAKTCRFNVILKRSNLSKQYQSIDWSHLGGIGGRGVHMYIKLFVT